MSSSLAEQQQQALAEFAKKREALMEARSQIKSISVTARSRDGAVEITIGTDGTPSGLRFPNNKFKEMTGQALAASVLEAMAASKAQVASRATAIMEAVGGTGPGTMDGGVLDRLNLDKLLDGGSLQEIFARRHGGDKRG
ncbi:YbaB/EbfC family nucleoid-associated protein [Streptomyces sp. NPDC060184]|uniref:YbaB/EbfC family nucleoid-associated protein n=1 Tax=Streptomyces sp. NPDC060184 TaxID=3347064 RepID=UPI0036625ACF